MACSGCFSGAVSTAQTTGMETVLHGLPTYVARPENATQFKGIIVVVTDAFGWKFVNNRVLCDRYAKNGGFLVYCPDLMNGHCIGSRTTILMDRMTQPTSWIKTIFYKPVYAIQWLASVAPWMVMTRLQATEARLVSFLQELRHSEPPFPTDNLKVGVAGFCYGGKHAFFVAQDDPALRVHRHVSQAHRSEPEKLADCVFTAHPALIDLNRDVRHTRLPTSVAIGDVDTFMSLPQVRQMKDVLENENEGTHEVVIVPGGKHGFAVRARPEDAHEMRCAEEAEVQAISWFTRWLA